VFAKNLGVDAESVAAARVGLNTISSLPWPEPERVSLLARLAHEVQADVGTALARLALSVAPLRGFDELIPLIGIAEKRALGLMRALADLDVKTFSPEATGLRDAWELVEVLRSENRALRAELDRMSVQQGSPAAGATPTLMRLGDVASSLSSQVGSADEVLRSRVSGLRLSTVELTLQGRAATMGDDLALDLATSARGSSVGFRFAAAQSPSGSSASMMVPNVCGYTVSLARRKLEAGGFSVAIAMFPAAKGVVSEQSPVSGTLLPSGSLVRLVVR
jgi:hypothetical protein